MPSAKKLGDFPKKFTKIFKKFTKFLKKFGKFFYHSFGISNAAS